MKPLYRAIVYLAQEIETPNKIKGIPCFYTRSSTDKESVLSFVKTLHEQNIIQSYRMTYSPNGDENVWYQDSEVVYLEFSAPIISQIFEN